MRILIIYACKQILHVLIGICLYTDIYDCDLVCSVTLNKGHVPPIAVPSPGENGSYASRGCCFDSNKKYVSQRVMSLSQ